MSSKQDSGKAAGGERGGKGETKGNLPLLQRLSSKNNAFCASVRQLMDGGCPGLVATCFGCLSPKMTIRLLGSFVLVSGVMISSAEGSFLVREERIYQRCLLRQEGLVADGRHWSQPPRKGNAQDLLDCYPNGITLVRVAAGLGMLLEVLHLLCTVLMFVAVATERWALSLPWAYGCGIVILQEAVLVGGCWSLLGLGDVVLYAIHVLLLAYSAAAMFTFLRLVKLEEDEEEYEREP